MRCLATGTRSFSHTRRGRRTNARRTTRSSSGHPQGVGRQAATRARRRRILRPLMRGAYERRDRARNRRSSSQRRRIHGGERAWRRWSRSSRRVTRSHSIAAAVSVTPVVLRTGTSAGTSWKKVAAHVDAALHRASRPGASTCRARFPTSVPGLVAQSGLALEQCGASRAMAPAGRRIRYAAERVRRRAPM